MPKLDVFIHNDPSDTGQGGGNNAAVLAAISALSAKIDQLVSISQDISRKEDIELADLTTLTQDVQNNNNVVQSAVTLLQGLKQQLDAAIAANDPAALKALSDQLESQTNTLAQAVAANTPAATGG